MITVRPAVPEDAARIKLRVEDLAEAHLYRFPSPRAGLLHSIEVSQEAFTALDGKTVVAIWGVFQDEVGLHPWLMSSKAVAGHSRALLGHARSLVQRLRASGLPINNLIGKQSVSNRRFVEHLGFRIVPLRNPVFDRFYLP